MYSCAHTKQTKQKLLLKMNNEETKEGTAYLGFI